MSSSIPLQIAETIQTASINHEPSAAHDLNPSTAASEKQPVELSHAHSHSHSHSHTHHPSDPLEKYISSTSEEDAIEVELDDDEEDIPYEALKPTPRRPSFGPLPDLRFEQSYLASIAGAETGWMVAYITFRDQVFLPLMQGTIWTLALAGWRHWNRVATLSGEGVGARVRRWWYKTNNWKLPNFGTGGMGRDEKYKFAAEVSDYYKNQSSGGD